MPRVCANGIEIEYDTFGDGSNRPLILIMGLASQMVGWHPALCEKLVKKGHYVVRFDNRDVGLSTKMEEAGVPDVMELVSAFQDRSQVAAPYTLSDMAADAVGLLDALGLEKAHVCGLSMGGMIAQTLAIEYPQRLLSLVSMESTTGEAGLPPATFQAMGAMFKPPPQERDAYIRHMVEVFRAFAGGSDLYDERIQAEISGLAHERSFYPLGFVRQLAAILASGSRREALADVTLPMLIVHGDLDPLLPLEHGKATAGAVPGAELRVVQGLGHGISYPSLWDEIVDAVSKHTVTAA